VADPHSTADPDAEATPQNAIGDKPVAEADSGLPTNELDDILANVVATLDEMSKGLRSAANIAGSRLQAGSEDLPD
jgi:hypothetical protein